MAYPANTRRLSLALAVFITMLFSSALAFLNLGEFYKTKILRQHNEYPFGGEGPAPYYYKTATLYANVHLVWGLLFFLLLLCSARTAIKRQGLQTLLLLVVTLLLLLVWLIQGQAAIYC